MATAREGYAGLLEQHDFQMVTSFKQTYIDALKQYYFVGGMPEAVQSFAENKDFNEVREIQKRILAAYEQDFPNMLLMRLFLKYVCFGTVCHRSLPKRIKSLFTELFAKGHALKNMKLLLCG